MFSPVSISSGSHTCVHFSTDNSANIPKSSQSSSCRQRLKTVSSERRRPSFGGPLSTPFRLRHVQPAMIRLLDLVPFGPVRPSSLCHGVSICYCKQFRFANPIISYIGQASPARLSNRGPPDARGRSAARSPQPSPAHSTTIPQRSCYTPVAQKGMSMRCSKSSFNHRCR